MKTSLVVLFAVIVTGCASHQGTTSVAAQQGAQLPQPAPAADQHAGHDMSAMASQAKVETAFLFPDGDDKGWSKVENGSQHNMAPEVPLVNLAPATRAELLRQLALTMDVIKKYPTVKDAEAAGYRRAGPFIPGLGTHYVGGRSNRTGTMTDDDITHPSTIIYDGIKQDSPIAGFMYISTAVGPNNKEPEGFAGPNDHWHYHTGICLTRGENGAQEALGFDGSITQENCKTRAGNWVAMTQYLLHVWTVPGYSNPLGVFGHASPALRCGDGTYYMDYHDLKNSCKQP